jgi:capsule biosynthesis phosphatase
MKGEYYISKVINQMIGKQFRVHQISEKDFNCLGTPIQLRCFCNNIPLVPCVETSDQLIEPMRICFDLDNTLVTYPETPGNYSTVKPIQKMIDLLLFLKKQGHEIIIYTARRMETHKSNIGKVLKDIALVTFATLDKFGILYDEIIFGKPIADIYIDDRAMNPYYNDISMFGFFGHCQEYIPNKIENNKYNTLEKIENKIKKRGPTTYIRGEVYFYQNIPTEVSCYFPSFYHSQEISETETEFTIDFINGIPLYFLYANQTLTTNIIDKCFDLLVHLHTCASPPITISDAKIKANYFDKIRARFNANDYPFDNSQQVFVELLENLERTYDAKPVPIIHGDFWFSNIILTYSDEITSLDMKGQIDNELTMNGDIYYDYGKMYQSVLGYDLVLHQKEIPAEYKTKINDYFLTKCREKGLNIEYLTWVTKSLIFGTFQFLPPTISKKEVWNWFISLPI